MMTETFEYDKQEFGTLDNLMEGFQIIGFDWRYLYVNKSVVKQSKYKSKKELLGFTMMEKYPGIEETELFDVLKICMKERVSKNMENAFTFPDQSKGWFELRIQPVPEGIFILSMDITERKRAEQNKEEHIKALESMLYMTSHRLRQPVTRMLGLSVILNKLDLSAEELKEIVNYMKESFHSLDEFTKELTTFIHEHKLKVIDKE